MRFPRYAAFKTVAILGTFSLFLSGIGTIYGAYQDLYLGGQSTHALLITGGYYLYIYYGVVGASMIFLGIINAILCTIALLNRFARLPHAFAILFVGIASMVLSSTIGNYFALEFFDEIGFIFILVSFFFSIPGKYYEKVLAKAQEIM